MADTAPAFDIHPVTAELLDDLGMLFASDRWSEKCWCMWWRIRVTDFHEQGSEGNRAAFRELVEDSAVPLGLVAYLDGAPVGWCAVGVRTSFGRVPSIPTMRGRNKDEDDTAWLVPCFFVHPDHRRAGVSAALLDAAVELAAANGATVIEGFPLAGTETRSRGSNFMTGVEPLFAGCEFEPERRPSSNRVIMRREL